MTALVTLDPDALAPVGRDERGGRARPGRAGPPRTSTRSSRRVKQLNAGLNRWETIKDFRILDHDLTVEAGELTPSLKLKRRVVEQRYKDVLDDDVRDQRPLPGVRALTPGISTHSRDSRTARDLRGELPRISCRPRCPHAVRGPLACPPCSMWVDSASLLAISEHGGSSGAARALGRPAGDVAGQLSDWERELGLPLVDGDRLTPAGRRLAEHAGTLLGQLESAESDAAAVGRPGRRDAAARASARTPAGCCSPDDAGDAAVDRVRPARAPARRRAGRRARQHAGRGRRRRVRRGGAAPAGRRGGAAGAVHRAAAAGRAEPAPGHRRQHPAGRAGRRGVDRPAAATRWWRWSGPRPAPGSRRGWSPRSARTRWR